VEHITEKSTETYYEYPLQKPVVGESILIWSAKNGRWFETTYSELIEGAFRYWIPQTALPIPTE
jgi:hypothetical protein